VTANERQAAYIRRHNVPAERYARFQAWLEFVKTTPCADCGVAFPAVCMDFDHVRGTKAFNVSQMHSRSKRLVFDEMSKCEVVCSNCHRVRTATRRAA